MNPFTRLWHAFIVMIGVIGIAICVAAAVVLWRTGARLNHVNQKVFDGIDTVLVASRDRVLAVQTRVQESKITTQDVREGVETWARKKAAERLVSRPEVERVENAAERLAAGLRQADLLLEMSGASLQGTQQALQVANSLGASADVTLVDPLLEKLGALRQQLKEPIDTVDAFRGRIADIADGESLEERLTQFAQLALRVVATLSDIDSRVGQLAERFVAARTNGQQMKDRIHDYIVVGQIGAALLAAWMAVGQILLCRYGWTRAASFGRA
jgi:hypothetical protein